MDKPININDMHVTESFIRFQILSQGKEAARFFDGLEGDFAQYFLEILPNPFSAAPNAAGLEPLAVV